MLRTPEEIAKEFTKELTTAARAAAIAGGVDRDSKLADSIEVVSDNGAIIMLANDYYQAVSEGRRPRTKKVKVQDLISWIKEKNISPRVGQSINQLAFAMQRSIYKNGIRGKNFINSVDSTVLDLANENVADGMTEAIADGLEEAFKV